MYKFLSICCALSGIVLIADGCKSTKDQATNTDEVHKVEAPMLEQIAEMRFGKPYDIQWNDTKNYALVTKKIKIRPNDPYPTIRFLVYDNQLNEVIYENTEPGGKVVWESDQVIHVSSAIGIPNPNSKNENLREYRYHVVNRKKYHGKFFKNQ